MEDYGIMGSSREYWDGRARARETSSLKSILTREGKIQSQSPSSTLTLDRCENMFKFSVCFDIFDSLSSEHSEARVPEWRCYLTALQNIRSYLNTLKLLPTNNTDSQPFIHMEIL